MRSTRMDKIREVRPLASRVLGREPTDRWQEHKGESSRKREWRPVGSISAAKPQESRTLKKENDRSTPNNRGIQLEIELREQLLSAHAEPIVQWKRRSQKATVEAAQAYDDSEDDFLETAAQVYVVSTRTTPQPETEEGEGDGKGDVDETQNLHDTIRKKDEQLTAMQGQINELMKAVASMTSRMGESHKDTRPNPTGEAGTSEIIRENASNSMLSREQLDQMVQQSVQSALAATKKEEIINTGRPYPKEYEDFKYPEGFLAPIFRMFDGIGNPKQHLA